MTDLPTIHPESRMLIDGKLVDASNGSTFDVFNPATGGLVGKVADGTAQDMEAAIAAARRAFDETDWSTNHEFRIHCLNQFQDALDAECEELRELLIQEVGAPRMLTHSAQLDVPLNHSLRHPISMISTWEWERDLGEAISIQGSLDRRSVVSMAAGVVGAITPWNFPFEVAIIKLAYALATGNTIVLKPAPDTPLNATLLGRLIAERTDIPAGVVNIVTSSDHLRGEQLTLSPLVDMISFTGSTAVGQGIMEMGSRTMKRLFLELGGKSATVVLDDADLLAASFMGLAVCTHAGQGCAIPTRMLLPKSHYDEGVNALIDMMKNVPYGDPQRPDVLQGPQISAKQRDRVMGYIQKGQEEGAKLVLGGGIPTGPEFDNGFFVEPTLFVDVDNSMTIAQEEIFGPVLVVTPYEDEDDAVRIANDSRYGLGGGVMAGSFERAKAVADRLRTGMVSINGGAPYGADLPFGGFKYSGVGRQNGDAGFAQYLELKSYAWPAS